MSEPDARVGALLAATDAVAEALARADTQSLDQALVHHARSLDAVAGLAAEDLSVAGRRALASAARRTAEVLAEARTVREALRRELDRLGQTRRAAREIHSPSEAPRFVSRRV